MPLLRQHMKEHRTVGILDKLQIADQVRQRVPLHRAEVAHAHRLEEHPAVERGLERILDRVEHPLHRFAHHRHALDHPPRLMLDAAVPGILADHVEVFGQGPDPRADRHPVVVEDHEEPLLQEAGVVEGLEDDSRREGAVPDDRDAPPVVVTGEIVPAGKAERRRQAAAGMTGHEQVVRALLRIGIAHQSAAGADRTEAGEAAGDQLVRVDLMTGIPDETVAAEVENAVQGQAQLDDAEVRGEVGGPGGGHLGERAAHLPGELFQLLDRQPGEVAGGEDRGKDVGHGWGRSSGIHGGQRGPKGRVEQASVVAGHDPGGEMAEIVGR